MVGIWCIHPDGKVWIPVNKGLPMKEWTVVGAGDFNGDGLPDLILQHTDGRIGAWCMRELKESTVRLRMDLMRTPGSVGTR